MNALVLATMGLLGASLRDDPAEALEKAYQKAAEKAAPWVVAIRVDREPEPEKPLPRHANDPFRFPFGGLMNNDVFAKRPASAWCTGTILEPDGVIVTTHFNVSGKVHSILVRLADGSEHEGTLLGYNGTYDLAAIKIDAKDLPVPKGARVGEMKAGNAVVALGRGPDGRGITLNPGIVSALARQAGRGLQTDARLNYGNVGGPLVDLEGRLVGITCKVDTRFAASWGQNSGVGFSVTHDRLAEVLADLKSGKNVEVDRRAFLGVQAKMEGAVDGVELEVVQAGSAAEKAGLKPGDVLVEFDGKKVRNFPELRLAIGRKAPGDVVKVKVQRGEEAMEVDCTLGWNVGE